MILNYTTNNGRMTVTLEGETQAELWRQLAAFQEVFEDTTCTKFNQSSDDVKFVVRENNGNEFFELQYSGDNKQLWGVRKSFGQTKQGGNLFPKRKWPEGHPQEGEYKPDNSWTKFDKEAGHEI